MKKNFLILIICVSFYLISYASLFACTPKPDENCCYDTQYQSECTDILSSQCGGGSCTDPCKNYIHCGARVYYLNKICYNDDGTFYTDSTYGPYTNDDFDGWYCGGNKMWHEIVSVSLMFCLDLIRLC